MDERRRSVWDVIDDRGLAALAAATLGRAVRDLESPRSEIAAPAAEWLRSAEASQWGQALGLRPGDLAGLVGRGNRESETADPV